MSIGNDERTMNKKWNGFQTKTLPNESFVKTLEAMTQSHHIFVHQQCYI